ncbi:MAG: phosphate starvation-inducible protein PhoH, partial [Desulfobacterales bacterium]
MKPHTAGDVDANTESYSVKLTFPEIGLARQLFGEHNGNLQKIAGALEVRVNARGNTVFIEGEVIAARLAENLLNQLYGLLEAKLPVHPNDVDYAI